VQSIRTARDRAAIACAVISLTIAAACRPAPLAKGPVGAPMNTPVAISSTDASGNVEAARRELEGLWELVTLESTPAVGKSRVPIQATGTLLYDAYGNLTINARTTDAAAPVAAREVSRLSFKGRAVIDPAKRELKLTDLTGNVNPDEVLSPEWRRRFEVNAGLLTLSSFDDTGAVTTISTWRKRP